MRIVLLGGVWVEDVWDCPLTNSALTLQSVTEVYSAIKTPQTYEHAKSLLNPIKYATTQRQGTVHTDSTTAHLDTGAVRLMLPVRDVLNFLPRMMEWLLMIKLSVEVDSE